MLLRIPREPNEKLPKKKKLNRKDEGVLAENIGKTGFQMLVEDKLILGFDHVGCECRHDGCDSVGIDFLAYLHNGLILGAQIKKDPGNPRKRERRVIDHYEKHPYIQCVIFVSLTKPSAHIDVYWEVRKFLVAVSSDPPIPYEFIRPVRALNSARF